MDWDVLEGEDSLIGTQLSTQGPFLFHVGGSESMRSVELGPSLGPVGAGGSAATPGMPAEDRWMGGDGSAAAPEVLMEGGSSVAAPLETREMSPPAREQGAGSKRSHPDELEQGSSGSSPKCSCRPKAPE